MKIEDLTFLPFAAHPGWLVSATTGEYETLELKARRLNEAHAAPGYDAVCGLPEDEAEANYRIYLAPEGQPGAIMEAFGVGTHGGDYSFEDPAEVLAEVEAIHARSRIVPFFADAAGLKFTFREPITPELLDFLEEHISIGTEAMMDDVDGSIRGFIEQEQHVHLWWD